MGHIPMGTKMRLINKKHNGSKQVVQTLQIGIRNSFITKNHFWQNHGCLKYLKGGGRDIISRDIEGW